MASSTHCSSISNRPKEIINSWITIPFLGGLLISLIYDFDELVAGEYLKFFQSLMVSFSFWTLLANGNNIIIYLIDRRWAWLEHPIKRAVIGTAGMLIYSPLASLLVIFCYVEFVLGIDFGVVLENRGVLSLIAVPMGITVIISLWGHGRGFFLEWRQAAIDIERLKNENLRSKFESLKSQVNPHFLFNSLNALTSLVYADQGKAVQFIQKLSEVYRYVLDHQNDEVVSLKEEVEFLKSFVFLNKIRFGDNLEVIYRELDTFSPEESIPPVTLQMLIENCIKHNEISMQNNLRIEIERIDDTIVVQNNINPIKTAKQDSSGLGLNNIIARYDMLSAKKVEVTESPSTFIVSVPILTFES
ncbi:MAG: histidine kinase [Reichenbachiella sp.]|uniref:sensor histidine kinase n=1 Tax=Reichenbachiella sp. TaxID=2184521 RepID=UPI00326593FF